MSGIVETLDSFRGRKILILGDVMLDRYCWGDVTRISPEAPVPVVALKGESAVAGGAANVAANVSGLGASPILVSVVGADIESGQLRDSLSSFGIDDKWVISSDSRPTTVKTRIVANQQQVVRIDRETSDALGPQEEAEISSKLDELIPVCDAVIISDYAKGVVSGRLVEKVVSRAAGTGLKVMVDPKGRDFGKYAGVSVLTPNRREAAEALGRDPMEESGLEDSARDMLERLGLEALLITLGERGMLLVERGSQSYGLPAVARETFDVTGAGDTVIATLTVGIASGLPLRKAAEIANIAAGRVVEHLGTTAITRDLLLA